MSNSFVPQISFRWWKPDGTPAFGYKVGYYGAGLSPIPGNLKNVYDEPDSSTPISNPVPFDVEGKQRVTLGSGGYKMVIYNDLDVAIYTQDNVIGSASGGGIDNAVSSIADLRLASPPIGSTGFAYVAGYYQEGDGGHGMFYWDSTDATPDDGGYTISPSSSPLTGRWKRVPDENGMVRAASFGYADNHFGNLTSNLSSADSYAVSVGQPLLIGKSQFATLSNITLSSPQVFIEPDVSFSGTSITMTFLGLVEAPANSIFANVTAVFSNENQISKPEWFGATLASIDNTAEFEKWITAGGGSFVLPGGDWNYADPSTFPWPSKPFTLIGRLIGSINIGPGFGYIKSATFTGGGSIDDNGTNKLKLTAVETTVDGDEVVTGNIEGQGNITASIDITAGVDGAGLLNQRLGASDDTDSPAVSNHSSQVSAAGVTASNVESNLMSKVIKGLTLGDDGDCIRLTAGGILSGNPSNSESVTVKIKFGGFVFATLTIHSSASVGPYKWKMDAVLIKESTNLMVNSSMVVDESIAVGDQYTLFATADFQSLAFDSTIDQTLQMRGVTSIGSFSITQHYLILEYIKAK